MDKELGLSGKKYDNIFIDNICHLISSMPFRKVTHFYSKFFNMAPSETLLQQIVRDVGTKISDKENKRQSFNVKKTEKSHKTPVKTVVSIDGGRCKIKKVNWKEVKMGVLYRHNENESFDKYYLGHTDMPSEDFGPYVKYKFANYSTPDNILIFLSDGMPYNWEIKRNYFSDAIEILDFYHACEHLSSFLKQRFAEYSNDFNKWYKVLKGHLYEGELKKFMTHLDYFLISIISEEKLKIAKRELKYFIKNYKRIEYKKYRDNDYPIGSGVIESGIKQIVNQRLKSSEKTWTTEVANYILKIKMCVENEDINDYVYKAA